MTPRVTPQVAAEVFERDIRIAGGCVPKYLGAPGDCRDKWGTIVRPEATPFADRWATPTLTIGHVREHSGGQRRSIPRWLISACWGHGVQGWELAHTQELRDYLATHA